MSDDKHPPLTKQHSPRALLDELGSIKELLDDELESAAAYTSVNDIGSVEEYLRLKQQAAASGLSVEAYLQQQAAAHANHANHANYTDSEEPGFSTIAAQEEEEEIPLLDEVYSFEEEEALESDSLLDELAAEEEEEERDAARTGSMSVEAYFAAVAAAKRPQAARSESAAPAMATEEPTPTDTPSHAIPLLEDVVVSEDVIPLLDEAINFDEGIPVLDEEAAASAAGAEQPLSLGELQGLVDLIVNRKLERLKPELEREVLEELRRLLPLPTAIR